jgi:4-aminobutyrate aminotransferase
MSGLYHLRETYPVIGDVRGLGLMVGVELTDADGNPATDVAKAVVKSCLKRHMLLLTCGAYGNTVRWIPPLVVTREEVDKGLQIFEEALAEAKSR